jgi:V8-like Glu-specific endopeptidase
MKLAALLALVLTGCGCVSVPTFSATNTAVRLEMVDGGICSGTAVGPYTILTARHCLDEDTGVVSVDGQRAGYALLADDGNDHVLIRVTVHQNHVARFGDKPERGAQVWKLGNPAGLNKVLLVGRVAGWLDNGDMLLDVTGYKGDSGAAVFDSAGRIVGVISQLGGVDAFYLMVAKPMHFTQKQLDSAAA